MGFSQGSDDSASRNHTTILSRDNQGNEHHLLVVDHPSGLVSLFDDEVRRTMAPAAAIELAVLLIDATRPVYEAGAGPISSTY